MLGLEVGSEKLQAGQTKEGLILRLSVQRNRGSAEIEGCLASSCGITSCSDVYLKRAQDCLL